MDKEIEYATACQTLNIASYKLINKSIDQKIDIIKKSYYKLALKHHPDKGGDSETFKEIKKAYDFLTAHNGICISTETDTFENIFVSFVESIIKNKKSFERFDNLFIKTTLKSILKSCDIYSIKVFSQLNLEKCQLIYTFLSQNKDMFYLSDDQLNKYKEVIQDKMKNNNIILLNPSLSDILNDNIYKLDMEDDTHYIPLWHYEIIIDNMIIKNIPSIPEYITINRNHDIVIKKTTNITELFNEGFIDVIVDEDDSDLMLRVNANDVKLTKDEQFIVFKQRGKLIPNKNNLYDNKRRGNIIIELSLTI